MRTPTLLLLAGSLMASACAADATTEPECAPECDADADPASPDASAADDVEPDAAIPESLTADDCLTGQDLNGADVDISHCPTIPAYPADVLFGDTGAMISLGAWEIGQTAEGEVYKYGSLSLAGDGTATLSYSGGSTTVDSLNLECWAKGYFRLRAILRDPPDNYRTLRDAGFQYRFFQFQTDLRNGSTGYREISSYQDHLVKWVTVISVGGVCDQTTRREFVDYVDGELARRGLR